jgi:hypothetical protein
MLTDMHKKSKLKKLLHIITGEVKQMPSEMPLWLQEIPNIGTCLGGEGVRLYLMPNSRKEEGRE